MADRVRNGVLQGTLDMLVPEVLQLRCRRLAEQRASWTQTARAIKSIPPLSST